MSLNKYLYTLQEQEDVNSGKNLRIKEFIKSTPQPSDEEVHKFAEDLGMSHDELEERIYMMFSFMLNNVGKHNEVPDSEYDSKELAMGIEVEKEHTNCNRIAKNIAKDHLSEISDYYTRLKKMESEAGVED